MVGSFGVHATVRARMGILGALVDVAASALVVLELEPLGTTATDLLAVLLVRVRAISVDGRRAAVSQILFQPPSRWAGAIVTTDGVRARVGASVISLRAFVDVDATSAILAEAEPSRALAGVRSLRVPARETAIGRLVSTLVDVLAGRAVGGQLVSRWAIAHATRGVRQADVGAGRVGAGV